MKSLSLSFIVFVFVCGCNNQPAKKEVVAVAKKLTVSNQIDSDKVIKSISDTNALLRKFFAPDTIINKNAKWKPDPDAKFNMSVSDDGYCYTCIDTIFKIEDEKKSYHHLPLYFIIFITRQNYRNGVCNCASCKLTYGYARISGKALESFSRNSLTSFNDTYGMNDSITLKKIGKGNYVLDIINGYQGSAFYEFETLYDINTFSEVFRFQCLNTHEDMFGDTSGYRKAYERKLIIIPNKKNEEYDDLKIITTETTYNIETEKKRTTKVSNKYYSWNSSSEQYESVKK